FNSTTSHLGRMDFPLVRNSVNNGVGSGNQCLTFNPDGFLSNSPCSPPNFTPEQTWLVGDTVVLRFHLHLQPPLQKLSDFLLLVEMDLVRHY
ncbi:hypothetical protein L208DRAFT_1387691, partial [Tricholoma matsutake]